MSAEERPADHPLFDSFAAENNRLFLRMRRRKAELGHSKMLLKAVTSSTSWRLMLPATRTGPIYHEVCRAHIKPDYDTNSITYSIRLLTDDN